MVNLLIRTIKLAVSTPFRALAAYRSVVAQHVFANRIKPDTRAATLLPDTFVLRLPHGSM
jgi:hypothetical protein